MGLVKLKINAKPKSGRGFNDAAAAEVIECLVDVWDDMKEALDGLNETDAGNIKDHFNAHIPGEEDLGDILFDSAANFEERTKFLDGETLKKYTDEILEQEVITMPST